MLNVLNFLIKYAILFIQELLENCLTWKKVLWINHAFKKLQSNRKVQICAQIRRIYLSIIYLSVIWAR